MAQVIWTVQRSDNVWGGVFHFAILRYRSNLIHYLSLWRLKAHDGISSKISLSSCYISILGIRTISSSLKGNTCSKDFSRSQARFSKENHVMISHSHLLLIYRRFQYVVSRSIFLYAMCMFNRTRRIVSYPLMPIHITSYIVLPECQPSSTIQYHHSQEVLDWCQLADFRKTENDLLDAGHWKQRT